MRFYLALAALFIFAASPAYALTSQEVGNFVASMNEVQALADQMEVEGKNKVLDARIKGADTKDGFSPYVTAAKTLKSEFPGDYKKLEGITKKHGFSSPEHWAATGDDVIEAFIASQMNGTTAAHIRAAQAQLTPEQLAQMPSDMRARMDQGIRMLEQIEKVPQSDRDAVAPHARAIETFMRSQAQ